MLIMFDTPQGVSSEAARDAIVAHLEAIAEAVYTGETQGAIVSQNGTKVGRWVITAPSPLIPETNPLDAHLKRGAR